MLHCRDSVRIRFGHTRGQRIELAKNALAVLGRNPANPSIEGCRRSVEPDSMLLHDIADRQHSPFRQRERWALPVILPLLPLLPPTTQSRTKISQTLERKQVCGEWYDYEIGRDQSRTIYGAETRPDIHNDHVCVP